MHTTYTHSRYRDIPLKCAPFVTVCVCFFRVGFHLNGFNVKFPPLCIWSVLRKQCDMRSTRPNTLEFIYLYSIDWATRLLTFISYTTHTHSTFASTEQYCSMITIIRHLYYVNHYCIVCCVLQPNIF